MFFIQVLKQVFLPSVSKHVLKHDNSEVNSTIIDYS